MDEPALVGQRSFRGFVLDVLGVDSWRVAAAFAVGASVDVVVASAVAAARRKTGELAAGRSAAAVMGCTVRGSGSDSGWREGP